MKTECTIDKRTKFGRDIVIAAKRMQCSDDILTYNNTGIHPGLVGLRVRDIRKFLVEYCLN